MGARGVVARENAAAHSARHAVPGKKPRQRRPPRDASDADGPVNADATCGADGGEGAGADGARGRGVGHPAGVGGGQPHIGQRQAKFTRDDLADLAVDELMEFDGMTEDRAASLIMAARAPLFAGENQA